MNPFLKIILFPISVIYGLVMHIRNRLFDLGLISQKKYPVPIINVGNLTMGGTGKTPHIEYLTRLLSDKYRVAILSRGYKRKNKGYLKATKTHTFLDLGDEPLQFFQKFPNITVAVCESRRKGIEQLLCEEHPPEVILLDDAYQHRFVKPSINILLTDNMDLYVKDFVVPCGRLREFRQGAKRADIIVVTKNEMVLSMLTKAMITSELKLKDYQKLFFSYIKYDNPVPLFDNGVELPDRCGFIQLIAGIANPYPLESYLKTKCTELESYIFPDHYQFSISEIQKIVQDFKNHLSVKKLIITTEKDAKRLQDECFKDIFQDVPIFYIPIKIAFHKTDNSETFDRLILDSIEKEIRKR